MRGGAADHIWLRPAVRHVFLLPPPAVRGACAGDRERERRALTHFVQALAREGTVTFLPAGFRLRGAHPFVPGAPVDLVLVPPAAGVDVALRLLREAPPVLCLAEQSGKWLGQVEHVRRGARFALRRRLRATVKGRQYDFLGGVTVECPSLPGPGARPGTGQVDIQMDDGFVTSMQCGLRVSLPSDPESVWMGGPLVHPRVPALLLVPLCPRSLTLRPLILPFSMPIRISLPQGRTRVALDYLPPIMLDEGDSLHLEPSPNPVPLLERDWMEVVQDWGWNE